MTYMLLLNCALKLVKEIILMRYTCFTSIVTIYTQILLVDFSLQNIPPQVWMRYSSRRLRSLQLVVPDLAYYITSNLVTYTGSTVELLLGQ